MEKLLSPVIAPCAWLGSSMANSTAWIHRFTPGMCDELEQAAHAVRRRGLAAPHFRLDDFPLPTVGPWLREIIDEVTSGRGFVLLRGLPVASYDHETLMAIYWGLGCHWGVPVTQNLAGDFVAQIHDKGYDVNKLDVKPSLTNAEQRPHSDPSDVVALLCIHQARVGGVSRIASTMSIYNALLAENPDWLDCLYRGFHHDLRGDASDAAPFGCTPMRIPVYRYYQGILSCVFNASTIKDAQRRMNAMLPADEMAILDHMVDLARSDTLRLDMDFEPGDIQLLNNYTTMHWRTGYTDFREPERKRRLYRLWMNRPGARAVDPAMHRGYITGSQAGMPVDTLPSVWPGATMTH